MRHCVFVLGVSAQTVNEGLERNSSNGSQFSSSPSRVIGSLSYPSVEYNQGCAFIGGAQMELKMPK